MKHPNMLRVLQANWVTNLGYRLESLPISGPELDPKKWTGCWVCLLLDNPLLVGLYKRETTRTTDA